VFFFFIIFYKLLFNTNAFRNKLKEIYKKQSELQLLFE